MNKIIYSIEEVCSLLSISKNALYQAVANREIDSIKYGRRRLFTKESVDEFVNFLTSEYSTRCGGRYE